jgi:hypothetical protein
LPLCLLSLDFLDSADASMGVFTLSCGMFFILFRGNGAGALLFFSVANSKRFYNTKFYCLASFALFTSPSSKSQYFNKMAKCYQIQKDYVNR